MALREEVFKVIDKERAYQQKTWPRSEALSTTGEITLIRSYLHDFEAAYQREKDYPDLDVPLECLYIVRKMAAILVRCMEHHGAFGRVEEMGEALEVNPGADVD